MNVLLASGSPRRLSLLKNLGWNPRVIVPEIDESPLPSEPAENLCVRLSAAKANKAAEIFKKENFEKEFYGKGENIPVIAADTIVAVDGHVLGKPAGLDESVLMLTKLQGRTHEVLTGLTVMMGRKTLSGLERTAVRFRQLDGRAIAAYAATGEGADKAGGYAIQGKGSLLVESIEGDYFNVVGLPLCKLGSMMEEFGVKLPSQWGRCEEKA